MAEGFIELSAEKLKTVEGVNELNRMLRTLYNNIASDTEDVKIFRVFGTPESAQKANVGSLALRQDGGANTTLYVKESGTTDTGWIAK